MRKNNVSIFNVTSFKNSFGAPVLLKDKLDENEKKKHAKARSSLPVVKSPAKIKTNFNVFSQLKNKSRMKEKLEIRQSSIHLKSNTITKKNKSSFLIEKDESIGVASKRESSVRTAVFV